MVVGCGAIGGTIAAGLARDGHEVLVCDAIPDVVTAVSTNGIRIEGPVENFTVPVTAVNPADLPERLDGPVLIAVKAHHTAAAAALVAPRLTGDGFVVSMQNGLNCAVLADAVGAERVVEACVNFGADAIAPGVILRGNRATLMVGETDGSVTDRVRMLAADIADAQVTDNGAGLHVGEGGLRGDAGGDGRQRPVDRRRAGRPGVRAAAQGDRQAGARAGAGAAGAARRVRPR